MPDPESVTTTEPGPLVREMQRVAALSPEARAAERQRFDDGAAVTPLPSRDVIVTRMARFLAATPKRYRDATFETFRTDLGDAPTNAILARRKADADRFVRTWEQRETDPAFPHVIVMRGDVGAGKTHLAYAICVDLIVSYGATCRVATLADIIRDLRESWRRRGDDEGPSERQRLAAYRTADLLVIDEVSRHALYGEPTQHLYDLIAPREANYQPTIITTNESAAGIEDLIGPALTSRAAGAGGVWDFGATDLRMIRRREQLGVAR